VNGNAALLSASSLLRFILLAVHAFAFAAADSPPISFITRCACVAAAALPFAAAVAPDAFCNYSLA
jgi:hypothetical protein